ncbi:tetratricopeptide repeat-containing sensor histidine kinase [Confluentibacter citreus]|uniref:tetratricopeptide repeat-containing sensor histidine kinase n=1 Tax=Confluentibacter citreus TaxID=2007307 RepID=UPI000C28FC55|nr:histidine kinase [Confluentibacter citreus]
MKLVVKYICVFFLLCIGTILQAQNSTFNTAEKFMVRGSVAEKDTRNPIKNVNVEVNGGSYTTTDIFGEFKIEVKKGDELIIKHQDFETVYYTIQNNERIMVLVESNDIEDSRTSTISKSRNTQVFKSLVDSAETYLKKDAKKSLQFITDALAKSSSAKENAEVYDVIGDIYMYWKQYDLAVSNYKISIQNISSNETKLKLAKAFQFNKNYQESIQTYNGISKRDLSTWQLVSLNEGLGDVNLLTKNYKASIEFYKEGLKVAEANKISAKITDLNSKIGEAYSASGNNEAAKDYFSKSLKLAATENKKRAAEEKVKVADFQNNISNYSNEIQLRKEALKDIEKVGAEKETVLDNENALTPQKQNYKIGSALALQGDYQNAILFLEKSIAEADKKEDLIVQKDATRRLSDVHKDAGDFKKALSVYQEYVDLVDKVYIKKEQEISQSARFSKELAAKQNRIVSLESDRELSESKYQLTTEQTKRQQLVIYSLIGGVLLLLLMAFLMFKYIKQQRLANNLLALKTLRSQMNPHFIFNALNSVNSFIASNDERTANKYLSDFSLLMRAVLENSEEDFIPLEKEIELLELYTKLEHFRFKDKFDYTIHIDENITIEDFVIPPMLLQPYIENAVWHGLRYKKSKGHLSISITQTKNDEITITIADNGIGREQSKALKTENQQKQNSKGMGNIKKRVSILNAMYKDKVDVFIEDYQDEEDTGTKVVVTLKKD